MAKLFAVAALFLCVSAYSQTTTANDKPASVPANSTQSLGDTAPPLHPATADQIREYFALTGTLVAVHEVMAQQVDGMRITAAPYYPASFWDDMKTEFIHMDLVTPSIPIYQKYLSTEDMSEIIRFYRSAAGKRILATQLPIGREAKEVFGKLGSEIGERVYERHKDEIETAKAKYDAKPLTPQFDPPAKAPNPVTPK